MQHDNKWIKRGRAFVLRVIAICGIATVLAGCAGIQAYNEGRTLLSEGKLEEGLGKLEEAVRHEPKNPEFRIELASRRTSIIQSLISSGDRACRDGRLTEAEKAYRQVQVLDPENIMARQGLGTLAQMRRHRQLVTEAEAIFKKGTSADLTDALERLRQVFSENPNQKDALNLKARIDEQRVKEVRPEIKLAATFRKPISLEFRDAPLKSILEVVAKVSGMNFYYDKDIRADLKATIFAKNTTVEDAMRLLLVTNQLEYKILSENAVLIYPGTPQKLKEYQTLAVRSFFLTNSDVKAVSNTLKTILKTKDMVTDERLGIIIMRDTPEAIRLAERIVALQDISDSEVMLEVEVMEVKRSRLLELGIQWPNQLTLAPLQTTGTPLTLEALKNLTSATTQATFGSTIINVRKEDQDGNILANPRIRVRNKEKAKIQIGDRVPVITTTSTSTGFVSESVSYVDVGLKLEVEPNIYLDEDVSIKVNLEVSNLVREIVSKSGTLSYQIGTRGANTILRLKDGETQVLAGLISDEDRSTANRVPMLGEFPLLGRLFGSQKDDTQRSEILLSITPRIVRLVRRPDVLDAEFEAGTESNIGAQSLRLTSVEVSKADTKDAQKPSGSATATPVAASAATAQVASASDGGSTVSKGTSSSQAQAASEPVKSQATGGAVGTMGSGSVALSWQAPIQAKVGEQFSTVLRINSQKALRGMPLLVSFDPQVVQVVNVKEGDYFKQANGRTTFSQRVDPVQGKVFMALVRQGESGSDLGINGIGSLATLSFKALKAAASTKIQVLSATPEPASDKPVVLPIETSIRLLP